MHRHRLTHMSQAPQLCICQCFYSFPATFVYFLHSGIWLEMVCCVSVMSTLFWIESPSDNIPELIINPPIPIFNTYESLLVDIATLWPLVLSWILNVIISYTHILPLLHRLSWFARSRIVCIGYSESTGFAGLLSRKTLELMEFRLTFNWCRWPPTSFIIWFLESTCIEFILWRHEKNPS